MFELCLGWFVLMVDVSLKALLLAGVTGLLLAGSRIRNSSLKHAAWLGVLGSLIGLPLVSPLIPAIPIPWSVPNELLNSAPADRTPTAPVGAVPPLQKPIAELNAIRRQEFPHGNVNVASEHLLQPENSHVSMTASPPANVIATEADTAAESVTLEPARTTFRAAAWLPIVAWVWGIGSLLLLVRLLLSIGMTRRLVQRSALLQGTELPRGATVSIFGTRRSAVSFRESSLIFVPLTAGWRRPSILLPTTWHSWPEDKLGHVLVHEFAHVRRGDCWTALVAELVVCVYWFHPLAWWLKRHLAMLAEECCDDAAIGTTGDRAAYARHLLEIASVLCESPQRLNYAGLAMTRRLQVERRILAILDPNRPLSQRLTWGALLLLVGASVPLVAIAAALKPMGAAPADAMGHEQNSTDASHETQVTLSKTGKLSVEQDELANSTAGFRVHGRVVDVEKQPLAGVTVAIRRIQRERWSSGAVRAKLLAEVTTDADGRYEHLIPSDQLPKPCLLHLNRATEWIQVAASSPGNGVEIQNITWYGPDQAFDLQLAPDTVVQGRVLNLEGRPVAGVDVRVLELFKSNKRAIDAWHDAAARNPDAALDEDLFPLKIPPIGTADVSADATFGMRNNLRVSPATLATATTDAAGKFELRGLGTDRLAILELAGPNFVRSLVNVVTRPLKPVTDCGWASHLSSGLQTYYGASFDCAISPSAFVEGVVRDVETKRPLAGALITTIKVASVASHFAQDGFIIATTDAHGHYRIDGLPPGKGNRLKVYPPGNEPYLVTGDLDVPESPNLQPVTFDIELRKAVWVTGRVYDISTNKPIQASLQYTPFWINPFLKNYPQFTDDNFSLPSDDRVYTTDADGRYRIPVIPGRGVLAAKIPDGGFIAGYGREAIPEFASHDVDEDLDRLMEITCDDLRPSSFHSLREIEPAADAEGLEVNLPLDPGVSVNFTFVDPDGKPVRRVSANSLKSVSVGTITDSETVTLSGFLPGKPTYLIFRRSPRDLSRRDPNGELARFQIVTPQANGESVRIQLEPLAKVRGRLVDADGKPWPGRLLFVSYKTDSGELIEPYSDGGRVDPNSRFEIDLIPGGKCRLTADGEASENYRDVVVAEHLEPKPGEVIDLGDVKVTEQTPHSDAKADTKQPAQDKPAVSATSKTMGYRIHGLVIGAQDKPISGAKILISAVKYPRWSVGPAEARLLATVTTNAQGRYEHLIPADQMPKNFLSANEPPDYEWLQVAAASPGRGVEIKNVDRSQQDKGLDLKLIDDVVVHGRVLTLEGRPVAGAAVRVIELDSAETAKIDAWYAEAVKHQSRDWDESKMLFTRPPTPIKGKADVSAGATFRGVAYISPASLPAVKTDVAGKFTLSGLGKDRLAIMEISGPNVVRSLVNVVTRPMKPVKDFSSGSQLATGIRTFYGSEFDFVTSPSAVVQGVVRDIETKQPLAGVIVTTDSISGTQMAREGFITATTDAKGRYRIEGLPPAKGNSLEVIPGERPYLKTGNIAVPESPALQPITLDIELRKAVWVTGRVFDRSTGKPVQAKLAYTPFVTNPFTKNYWQYSDQVFCIAEDAAGSRTDEHGRFRIAVIPGRGVVAAQCDGGGFVAGYGRDQIEEYKENKASSSQTTSDALEPSWYHSIREIDPAADAAEIDIELPVDPGMTVKLTLIDPNGQPVPSALAQAIDMPGLTHRSESYQTTLSGLLPGKPVIFWFRQQRWKPGDKPLGKVQVVTPNAAGEPTVVRMERLAHASGRLVGTDGKPSTADQLSILYEAEGGKLHHVIAIGGSDADGRFEIDIPVGGKYRLTAPAQGKFAILAEHLEPKPGEVIDLGDIVIAAKKKSVSTD